MLFQGPISQPAAEPEISSDATLPAETHPSTPPQSHQDDEFSFILLEDSGSELSSAPSDISDDSDCQTEDISPISEPGAVRRPVHLQERPVNVPTLKKPLPRNTSSAANDKKTKPPKWRRPRLHRIPAQFALPKKEQGGVLIHLTFQRDFNGNLFHPPGARLDESESLILSQSVSQFKQRDRQSGRLVLSESVTGFSATLPQSTTQDDFERHVQQLLRAHFLHPAPERLGFQFEFYSVHEHKDGRPLAFDSNNTALYHFHKETKTSPWALSVVVTKIFFEPENDPHGTACPPAFDYVWTHWVRVGDRNRFVDRFPACVPGKTEQAKRDDLPPPFKKNRAVLFGAGVA